MTRIKRKSDIHDPTVPKVVVDRNNFALFFSRYPIPYSKDDSPTYYKQVCVHKFTPERLFQFNRLERGYIERCEGIEMLRLIENGIPLKMGIVDKDTVAVDVPEDLKLVNELI